MAGYGLARIFVEFFREPDQQLGYLFGGWLTMGMVLSVPMVLAGIWAMATARRTRAAAGRHDTASAAAGGADRGHRADQRRRLHGACASSIRPTATTRRREPFGPSGDFVTAPEISQMFGELVGVWLTLAWEAIGSPLPVTLAEIGPGRGTLMTDIARTLSQARSGHGGWRRALRWSRSARGCATCSARRSPDIGDAAVATTASTRCRPSRR